MNTIIKIITSALYLIPYTFSLPCFAQNISTFAGTGTAGYSGDGGLATNAMLRPYGVAVDASGNVYIADDNNRIRKVNTSGVISTFAGGGGSLGDGGPATSAQLNFPSGVAVDVSGNVYIADGGNHRIRKVNTSGIISTIAGTGTNGYSGDGGLATNAQLDSPYGVAVDVSGNVFISDYNNNCIRKINTSGVISTFAQLILPYGIAVDVSGNLYIAHVNSNSIIKVDPSGVTSTFAGPSTGAQLYDPSAVAVDASGNVYIADESNYRIRMVNTSGVISTVAGGNGGGFSGDGGPATSAKMKRPTGVAVDASCNMYIADLQNSRVRKVDPISGCVPTTVELLSFTSQSEFHLISIYPNPATDYIEYLLGSPASGGITIKLYDALGREVFSKAETIGAGLFKERVGTQNFASGNYLLRITNGNKGKTQKQFVVK